SFYLLYHSSTRSVAARLILFTTAWSQPNMETLPSLSLVKSAISSKEYSSANLTAELIDLVANSVVFLSAISIKVGLIPLSIIQILRKIRTQTTIKDNINIDRAWGGVRLLL